LRPDLDLNNATQGKTDELLTRPLVQSRHETRQDPRIKSFRELNRALLGIIADLSQPFIGLQSLDAVFLDFLDSRLCCCLPLLGSKMRCQILIKQYLRFIHADLPDSSLEHTAQDMAPLSLQGCSQVVTDAVGKCLEWFVCLFEAKLLEVTDCTCEALARELDLVEESSDLALEVQHGIGTDG